jgi:transaldolase/glucose-6-phosphate isomerase
VGNVATLRGLGSSIYYDGISRSLVSSGEAARLIASGVSGVTSNPVIFHQAISGSRDYDDAIKRSAASGRGAEDVLWDLIVDDIQQAADLLGPVFRESDRVDGYISVEVHPSLADDSVGTIDAARRLWERINRPNVMIKVPATEAGISTVQTLTAEGVNVNVTVVATVEECEAVFRGYSGGLEERLAAGRSLDVDSVASLFLARLDTVVDGFLDELALRQPRISANLHSLRGQGAMATAKLAYQRFLELQAEPGFAALRRAGAHPPRLLLASTAPKDPRYPNLMYVEGLIGPRTILTLPPHILEEFEAGGSVRPGSLLDGLDAARSVWAELRGLGMEPERVTQGVQGIVLPLFASAMQQLERLVAEKHRDAAPRLAPTSGTPGSTRRDARPQAPTEP